MKQNDRKEHKMTNEERAVIEAARKYNETLDTTYWVAFLDAAFALPPATPPAPDGAHPPPDRPRLAHSGRRCGMKYRKKPVVIEAMQTRELIRDATTNWMGLPPWFRSYYENGKVVIAPDRLFIQTLEGEHTAQLDDIVICGVRGELYPCKPEIFAMTYEPVEDVA